MKKQLLWIGVAILGMGVWNASPVKADIIPVETDDIIKLEDPKDSAVPHYSNGGPFWVDNISTGENHLLLTFCLEKDETIAYGTHYRAELSDIVLRGGANTDAGDPLDTRTAYLFTNFHHGTDTAKGWSTKDLQEAIWFIEEELPGHTLSAGAKALVEESNKANGSLYDVRAMNLYQGDVHRQSVLTVVPEPATVVLWGICGVCGLVLARRRKRSV